MLDDNVWLHARHVFSRYRGVVGVGHGPKLRAGKVVAPLALIIFVERKLPPGDVPEGELVKPMFEGWPTDVRVPKLVPAQGDPPNICLTDYQWIDWALVHRRRNQVDR